MADAHFNCAINNNDPESMVDCTMPKYWTDPVNGRLARYGAVALDLQVREDDSNGKAHAGSVFRTPDWGDYQEDHVYSTLLRTSNGATALCWRIYDPEGEHTDNTGSLEVQICGTICGGPGQGCCANRTCQAGNTCGSDNRCLACGGPGQLPCCGYQRLDAYSSEVVDIPVTPNVRYEMEASGVYTVVDYGSDDVLGDALCVYDSKKNPTWDPVFQYCLGESPCSTEYLDLQSRYPGGEFTSIPDDQCNDQTHTYPFDPITPDSQTIQMRINNEPVDVDGHQVDNRSTTTGSLSVSYCVENSGHATSWGDPHIISWDGLLYDAQAVGEFIAVTDNIDLDEAQFAIQVRQEPRMNSTTIAVNTAVATRAGDKLVRIHVRPQETLRIDNEIVDLPVGQARNLGGGDLIWRETTEGGKNTYIIVWHTGERLAVTVPGRRWLNLIVSVPTRRMGPLLTGLYGTFNGDLADEFRTRGAMVLPQPIPPAQFYGTFVNSWRIKQAESWFYYEPGTDTGTYTDVNFPYSIATTDMLTPEQRATAQAICMQAGVTDVRILEACIFDVAMTGEPGFAVDIGDVPPPVEIASPACHDNLKNGRETGVDCGGGLCRACMYGEFGASCTQPSDCNTWACDHGTCAPAASCRAIQIASNGLAPSGKYQIDPDGSGPLPSFDAFCDMAFRGGGWTVIDSPCTARSKLGGTFTVFSLVEGDNGKNEPNDNQITSGTDSDCRPWTQDTTGGHWGRYEFTFPYHEFLFRNFSAHSNAAGKDLSDIHPHVFHQTVWGVPHNRATLGDISFGAAENAGPTTSYAKLLKQAIFCDNTCQVSFPGVADAVYDVGLQSTRFRIEWGEHGPEYEGWFPWWSGAIYLR